MRTTSSPSFTSTIPSYISDNLKSHALDYEGILPPLAGSSDCRLQFCSSCLKDLKTSKTSPPKLSLANEFRPINYKTADLPKLNFTEEQVIARVRLNDVIVKLHSSEGISQIGFRGHVIGVPQNPDKILALHSLPIPATRLPEFIHILFVIQRKSSIQKRSLQPYRDYFSVSREKIYMWLQFLKRYNFYSL
jgi:hypothetical protein